MSKKLKLLLASALILALLGGGALGLVCLVVHEKSYYARLTPPPGDKRQDDSHQCFGKLVTLYGEIKSANNSIGDDFTQQQLNSYFCEDFITSGMSENILPDGMSDPRISLEDDGVVQLGFHYGKLPWRTLITVRFRVWLACDEPNVLCFEVLGLHAGGLSIATHSLLERIFDGLTRQNIDVRWYSYHGHHTAALRFQSDQVQPTVQLIYLRISEGLLEIGGKSVEPGSAQ